MKLISIKIVVLLFIGLVSFFIINISNNPAFSAQQCAYSLIVHNSTPKMKPGETLHVELFISGYGTFLKDKLSVTWSSPDVIDTKNPGNYVADHNPPIGIDITGVIMWIEPKYFTMSVPNAKQNPPYGFPQIIPESQVVENEYPLLFNINTSKTAPSGDYNIVFIFTYGDDNNVYQDYKTTSFHITSTWERTQDIWEGCAVVIALASLLWTAIFTFKRHRHDNK